MDRRHLAFLVFALVYELPHMVVEPRSAMIDRKKPGVAFWATVVVVVAIVGLPGIYLLALGPALAMYVSGYLSEEMWGRLILPATLWGYYVGGPDWLFDWHRGYMEWWVPAIAP
jgi:hypothetical protein